MADFDHSSLRKSTFSSHCWELNDFHGSTHEQSSCRKFLALIFLDFLKLISQSSIADLQVQAIQTWTKQTSACISIFRDSMLDSPRCKYSLKHSWISPTAAPRPARTRSLNPIQLTTSFAPGFPRTRPPLCLSRNSIHGIAEESLCALATARLELRLAHWVLIFLWCTQGRLYIHPASYGTSVLSSALHRFNWFPPSLSGSLCSVLSFFPLYRFRVASWLYTDVCRVYVHDGGLCSGVGACFYRLRTISSCFFFSSTDNIFSLNPRISFPKYYNPPPPPRLSWMTLFEDILLHLLNALTIYCYPLIPLACLRCLVRRAFFLTFFLCLQRTIQCFAMFALDLE